MAPPTFASPVPTPWPSVHEAVSALASNETQQKPVSIADQAKSPWYIAMYVADASDEFFEAESSSTEAEPVVEEAEGSTSDAYMI
ncbi:hypothetical protein NW759_002538 [Fusarium solani]|nr:hypothetical protein NW759_002538 [Fusarium solani]